MDIMVNKNGRYLILKKLKRPLMAGLCFAVAFICLLCYKEVVEASESVDYSEIIASEELEVVSELPDGIVPVYVETEEELSNLLKQLEEIYSYSGTTAENMVELQKAEVEMNSLHVGILPNSTQVVNNRTLTHTEAIFDLSSFGGKVVSDVNYTYSYWVAPERYNTIINYHDVYETGIYGFQEITYFNKSATSNGSTISVNVRGNTKVYIGISGGGANGNLVLKTFPFDKTYTIYVGLN